MTSALQKRVLNPLHSVNIIGERPHHLKTQMEPAIALNISILATIVGLTGYAVYTAFGPPAKELDDPFEDHED